jgi:CRISPR-associated exonuclease Cas4
MNISTLIPFVFTLLIIVVIIFIVVLIKRKSFGTIAGNNIYTDTRQLPGDVLYSEGLHLKGKPDYIIQKGNQYIPVEVKTGRTPSVPYKNHVAQLFAYCALIQEEYGVRPQYGVIKYPEREFEIEYTKQGEEGLRKIIHDMQNMKQSETEPECNHPEHNKFVHGLPQGY